MDYGDGVTRVFNLSAVRAEHVRDGREQHRMSDVLLLPAMTSGEPGMQPAMTRTLHTTVLQQLKVSARPT